MAKVKREILEACMTCPLCNKLLKEATTISLCLHTFCRKCIYDKLSDDEVDSCPVCDIDLGCLPMEKLRPDHNLQDIRAKIFPFKRRKIQAPEVMPSINLPAKRKERSLSSLVVSTPKVSIQTGFTGKRSKASARKAAGLQACSFSIDESNKNEDSEGDNSTSSSSPRSPNKSVQNKRLDSSVAEPSNEYKAKVDMQDDVEIMEGKADLWKPLNCLVEAANRTKSSKSNGGASLSFAEESPQDFLGGSMGTPPLHNFSAPEDPSGQPSSPIPLFLSGGSIFTSAPSGEPCLAPRLIMNVSSSRPSGPTSYQVDISDFRTRCLPGGSVESVVATAELSGHLLANPRDRDYLLSLTLREQFDFLRSNAFASFLNIHYYVEEQLRRAEAAQAFEAEVTAARTRAEGESARLREESERLRKEREEFEEALSKAKREMDEQISQKDTALDALHKELAELRERLTLSSEMGDWCARQAAGYMGQSCMECYGIENLDRARVNARFKELSAVNITEPKFFEARAANQVGRRQTGPDLSSCPEGSSSVPHSYSGLFLTLCPFHF